jgi:cardiolipin synthase
VIERTERSPDRKGWLTLPNLVTVVRLVLVVPIVLLLVRGEQPVLTLALLVAFGASDWIDGFLARRLGQVSRVGALLDPIADRIGVVAIVAGFILAGMLGLWVGIVIVVVDAAVAGSVALRRFSMTPRVSVIGKIRTALLMLGLALLGLGLLPGYAGFALAGQVVAAVGAVLHVLAGIGYVRAAIAASAAPDSSRGGQHPYP